MHVRPAAQRLLAEKTTFEAAKSQKSLQNSLLAANLRGDRCDQHCVASQAHIRLDVIDAALARIRLNRSDIYVVRTFQFARRSRSEQIASRAIAAIATTDGTDICQRGRGEFAEGKPLISLNKLNLSRRRSQPPAVDGCRAASPVERNLATSIDSRRV